MSAGFILFNDVFVKMEEPILKADNRAFRYGDGIFESMRIKNGKLQYADLHATRIGAAMKALKMEGSNLMDAYFLKTKTSELCKKNKLNGNIRCRLSIFRAGEGFYQPESNKVSYILECVKTESAYELNQKGLIVDVYNEIPKPINLLSNFKTSNAMIYVLAGLFKKGKKIDEAILLNQNGFICEAISSNIFVVYNKQIYTPSLSEGCVAGVMRLVVMQVAKENGIEIIEAQINPKILLEAEEVFLTNATGGIKWVMGYGRKRYFNEMAKFLSAKLNEVS